MTTGKTIALARWTFVGKVISLLFNMLSRLVITFLPRSKCLNFMAAVTICNDFGAPAKVWHCFHYFPIYLPWSDGTRCHDLSCPYWSSIWIHTIVLVLRMLIVTELTVVCRSLQRINIISWIHINISSFKWRLLSHKLFPLHQHVLFQFKNTGFQVHQKW